MGWNNALLNTREVDGVMYHLAFVRRTVPGSAEARGGYFPNTRNIYFRPDAMDAAKQDERGDIFSHELFHAVQNAEAPVVLSGPEFLWIAEGTAQVEPG